MCLSAVLKEPFYLKGEKNHRALDAKVAQLFAMVGLPDAIGFKYPHELSGGECQRVCIARALSVEPSVLICDEPISSLDSASRAHILNLLLTLQKERGVSMLFITHDVQSAAHMSDEILVMKDGDVCESAPTDILMKHSKHPYTKLLIEKSL